MDVKQVALGILDGISSIPNTAYMGVVRSWEGSGLAGDSAKQRNQAETERFFYMLKSLGNAESPLRRLITIVFTSFYQKLNDDGKEAVNNKLGYGAGSVGGRTAGQIALAQTTASLMLNRLAIDQAYKHFIRFSASAALNVVMFQGIIEESARASRRMKAKYPSTYARVSKENLDMVYFLVEQQLEPYLVFIEGHPIDCKGIQNEICKIVNVPRN
ncbi:MAG: hypothetical protein HFE70_19555 [Enterobacter sp.]|uniref:hypothetical protein n=1 Tax=Enterobacter sp. TaxID=42895 RepID=UPI0025855B3F|nr:hypothetical protein [Enterobacter sp.]MCI8906395.1 hypothetical protein [Enterobacter sp.]